jgi:hypothetical protein
MMSVATGTAIAIGLGAGSAAASIYGAHKQAKAAEKASEQQQQAAREAIAYAEPKYQQALQIAQQQAELGRAGLQPYNLQGQQGLAAGQQGLTALSALLGLPASAGAAPMLPDRASAGMPPAVANPNAAAWGRAMQGGLGIGAQLIPGGNLQKPIMAGGAGTTGATVMLRAPTGQQQAVPADQVAFYLARGATRV